MKQLPGDRLLIVEKAQGFSEDAVNLAIEGSFELNAQIGPVLFAHFPGKREGVLPLIAHLQHAGEERFAVSEAVVAEIEKAGESLVERGIRTAEMFEGATGSESVQRIGFFEGLKTAAEARQQRAVVSDAEAERVDGLDREALRVVEDVPATPFGVGKGISRSGHAVEVLGAELATAGGGFQIAQDTAAHLRGRGPCESDGENLLGLVDCGKEAQIAAGEQVGFAGACGGLNDD